MKPGIKLMPDYHSWPLWHHGGETVGNIDPNGLGVSSELADRLVAWPKVYDSHLTIDDPASTSWTTEEEREFDSVGRLLCRELAEQIGERFDVFYFDFATKSVVRLEKKRV